MSDFVSYSTKSLVILDAYIFCRWNTSIDKTFLVIELQNVADPWIDSFARTTFNIHATVVLQSDSDAISSRLSQDFNLAIQSSISSVSYSNSTRPFRGGFQTTPLGSLLKFCPCDNNNICFNGHHASLSYLVRQVRVCMLGPTQSMIRMSSLKLLGMNQVVHSPEFIIEYDGDNKNLAIITGKLSQEFLDMGRQGFSLLGTTAVVSKSGKESEEGFIVHYDMNALMSSAGKQTKDNILTIEDSRDGATVRLQVCQCSIHNTCEIKALLLISQKIRICLLAQDFNIGAVSMRLIQENKNEPKVSASSHMCSC